MILYRRDAHTVTYTKVYTQLQYTYICMYVRIIFTSAKLYKGAIRILGKYTGKALYVQGNTQHNRRAVHIGNIA